MNCLVNWHCLPFRERQREEKGVAHLPPAFNRSILCLFVFGLHSKGLVSSFMLSIPPNF